jgi:catechol 2,3-dioxygenase-like lactoylglutathione lyase family enzyme
MFNAITHSSIFVLDQDEALDFYVGKLGLEVASDVDMGFMRWLTVRVPGQDREILLEKAPPHWLDEDTGQQVRDLVTKGALGLGFILTTDDCRGTYEALKAKGVEFTEEPTEHFYGIDCGVRDPFGNSLRITQPAAQPLDGPRAEEQVREAWA